MEVLCKPRENNFQYLLYKILTFNNLIFTGEKTKINPKNKKNIWVTLLTDILYDFIITTALC